MTLEQFSTGTGASGRGQLFLSDPSELVNLVVRSFVSEPDGFRGHGSDLPESRAGISSVTKMFPQGSLRPTTSVPVLVKISQQPFQSVFTMADTARGLS